VDRNLLKISDPAASQPAVFSLTHVSAKSKVGIETSYNVQLQLRNNLLTPTQVRAL
jgi:hypothetical protein